MSRIVTLTLSPALDVATAVPRLYPDAKLRCAAPVYAPGGGGINVARAIQRLGGRALAVFPAGGSTGRHLTELLNAEGVPNQALAVDQWTRECINLVDLSSAQQYRLVMPAAQLGLEEQEQLLAALQALPRPDYLVVSGSLPDGLDEAFVPRLLDWVRQQRVRCIFDSGAVALGQALACGGVFLIKPNIDELGALAGVEITDPGQLVGIARGLIAAGQCQVVLASLGPQGALLVSADTSLGIAAPTVRKRSTVGAGDSMVAALTLKLAAGCELAEAARYGVAAGTAAIITEGSELCRRADTEQLFAWLQQHSAAGPGLAGRLAQD